MGYALGRIVAEDELAENMRYLNNNLPQPVYHGHVGSIAINSKYRGHGVGLRLMNALHTSFVRGYHVDKANLYCRVRMFL